MEKFIKRQLEEFESLAPEYGKWRVDRNMAKAFLKESIQLAYELGEKNGKAEADMSAGIRESKLH